MGNYEVISYNNIEAERGRKGWTKTELAEQVGVGRSTLYSWMKKGDLPASMIKKLAILFGCSADYLLGLEVKTG